MISRIKPDNIRAIAGVLIWTAIAAMLVIPGIAILQTPARAFAGANVDQSGHEMRVRLERTLSCMFSRVGDEFIATVTDPGLWAPERQPLADAKNSFWTRAWRCCFALTPTDSHGSVSSNSSPSLN